MRLGAFKTCVVRSMIYIGANLYSAIVLCGGCEICTRPLSCSCLQLSRRCDADIVFCVNCAGRRRLYRTARNRVRDPIETLPNSDKCSRSFAQWCGWGFGRTASEKQP